MGGILDLGVMGAILDIHEEKMLPRCCRGVAGRIRCLECTRSITMMIYYSQGAGGSLNSQYSLQESIPKIKFERAPQKSSVSVQVLCTRDFFKENSFNFLEEFFQFFGRIIFRRTKKNQDF